MEKQSGIYGFFGNFRWLSNFYLLDTPIIYEDMAYPSAEHAYQAAKSLDRHVRQKISEIKLPRDVKSFAKTITLRDDWEKNKLFVMTDIVTLKFHDINLRNKLLNTGSLYLEETNSWGDTYWGVCDGRGENYLGKILMMIRSDIRE